MKKLFSFIAFMALSVLLMCSCSDSDTDIPEPQPQPETTDPDYLLMFYGQGGGNLDPFILANIYQALDEGSSDKVKMTFQYKLSAPYHAQIPQFDGTRRATLDDNKDLVGTFKTQSPAYPALDEKGLKYLMENLKSEKIGDKQYDVSSPEKLGEFIQWSKKQYPTAKRTILVISGHGKGWDLVFDGQRDTRAILPDDILNNKQLSLMDVVTAVKGAGGVDLFYTDACLMSVYENLYGYKECFKYLLAAQEVTQGLGGNYTKLLQLLKSADASDASLENAMRKYCDFVISKEWWDKNGAWSDIGFYDLSKLDNVTPVLKKITNTLVEKYTSGESVQPLLPVDTPEIPIADRYDAFINFAMNTSEIAWANQLFAVRNVPVLLKPYLEADNITQYNNNGEPCYNTYDLVGWLRDATTENAHEAFMNYPEDWAQLKVLIIEQGTYAATSLTDFLRVLDFYLTAVQSQNNPFGPLRNELIAAIKTMAYIRCTEPVAKPGIDQAYELCSPGLSTIPLNDKYYIFEDNYMNLLSVKTVEEAIHIYEATIFDQQIGWGRFLKLLNVHPSIFSNKPREYVGMELYGED